MDAIVRFINTTAFSLAYMICIAASLKKNKLKLSICLVIVFLIEIAIQFKFNAFSNISLYLDCFAIAILINSEQKNMLSSFCISISALKKIQIIIMTLGSVVFLILPAWDARSSAVYNASMQIAIIIFAAVIHKKNLLLPFIGTSIKQKRLDLIYDIVFLCFVNTIFPIMFSALGKNYYALICIIFLFASFITSIYGKENNSLENKIKMKKLEMDYLIQRGETITEKHNEIIALKHYYHKLYKTLSQFILLNDMQGLQYYFNQYISPINQKFIEEQNYRERLNLIEIPVLQSLFFEMIHSLSFMTHVDFHFDIKNRIANVAVDSMDLFTIINILTENALEEIDHQENAYMFVFMANLGSKFTFEITNSMIGNHSAEKPHNSHKGLEIVKKILAQNPNLYVITDRQLGFFSQKLVVHSKNE